MSCANVLSIDLIVIIIISTITIHNYYEKYVSPVDVHVVLLKLKLKCVTYEQCEIIKFCFNFSGQTPSIDTLAMEHRVNIQLKR